MTDVTQVKPAGNYRVPAQGQACVSNKTVTDGKSADTSWDNATMSFLTASVGSGCGIEQEQISQELFDAARRWLLFGNGNASLPAEAINWDVEITPTWLGGGSTCHFFSEEKINIPDDVNGACIDFRNMTKKIEMAALPAAPAAQAPPPAPAVTEAPAAPVPEEAPVPKEVVESLPPADLSAEESASAPSPQPQSLRCKKGQVLNKDKTKCVPKKKPKPKCPYGKNTDGTCKPKPVRPPESIGTD